MRSNTTKKATRAKPRTRKCATGGVSLWYNPSPRSQLERNNLAKGKDSINQILHDALTNNTGPQGEVYDFVGGKNQKNQIAPIEESILNELSNPDTHRWFHDLLVKLKQEGYDNKVGLFVMKPNGTKYLYPLNKVYEQQASSEGFGSKHYFLFSTIKNPPTIATGVLDRNLVKDNNEGHRAKNNARTTNEQKKTIQFLYVIGKKYKTGKAEKH